jgi:hypothetical protein
MARLYAKCNVPSNHVAGRLGWTLTYQDPFEKHYERYTNTNQTNNTNASLTVYSNSNQIPARSNHFNISTASSFQYINSPKGYSFATQSGLAIFNNLNVVCMQS